MGGGGKASAINSVGNDHHALGRDAVRAADVAQKILADGDRAHPPRAEAREDGVDVKPRVDGNHFNRAVFATAADEQGGDAGVGVDDVEVLAPDQRADDATSKEELVWRVGGQGEADVSDADVAEAVGKRTAPRGDHNLVSQPNQPLGKLKQMRLRTANAKTVDDKKDFQRFFLPKTVFKM